ncbi:MAG: ATP-binding cassette domain-containing protein [Chloroflexi bacterium]|nr:ATP-binding cassette domain-containing protein [Chloroflexota bacterium]
MTPLFHLSHIRHNYNGRFVLDIDELTIQRGELFAIVGPSGAGKSTLLRLLNFLESASTGNIRYKDHPAPPLDLTRQITTVFQHPILLHRTVRENVEFGLRLRDQRDDKRVEEIIARVGLAAFAASAADSLSGGERQRIALARALVLNPEVLLLDEPTANLDPHNVSLIESIIRQENEQRGTTILLVTHNVFQAKRLAARVGLMLNGKLIEVAAVQDFFENPKDERTRKFVDGEMIY